MNTTAELTMYQGALQAEGTTLLRWDLNADRVYDDYSLQGVIPEKLKEEKYSVFLLQSLPLRNIIIWRPFLFFGKVTGTVMFL